MAIRAKLWDLTGGAFLVRAGVAGRLTTIGRKSGLPRTVQCGFVPRADGTLLIGSAQGRKWPANLAGAGWCMFEARDLPARRYDAVVLEGARRQAALDEIRRARGDRALRMFSGLVFELQPSEMTPGVVAERITSG